MGIHQMTPLRGMTGEDRSPKTVAGSQGIAPHLRRHLEKIMKPRGENHETTLFPLVIRASSFSSH
jgi:hypothetical protein